MQGDFVRARDLYRTARALLEDLGAVVLAATVSLTSGPVELLAGDVEAAERELRRDYECFVELGELYNRPTVAGLLAQALYAQGRVEEAEELVTAAAEIAAEDDIDAQTLWRSVKAKILADRDEIEEAVCLGREAVSLVGSTDDVYARTQALLDLAQVLESAGADGAVAALVQARDLCRLKGVTVLSERIDGLLDAARRHLISQRA